MESNKRRNRINIILSVLLAIGLWAYVIIEENPTVTQKFENIPVHILNEESLTARQLIIVQEETPTVTVTLEGKRGDISKIEAGDIIVTADVYGYSIGENHIPVTVEAPGNVTIADVKSTRVTVQIEELVSTAHGIEVVAEEDLPQGKELYITDILPQEVMVTGARSIVNTVASVQAVIDASSLGEKERTVSGELVALSRTGEVVNNVKLSATNVEVTAWLLSTKEVPLSLEITGDVASNYTVSDMQVPEKITIKGTKEVISLIDVIYAEPIDISDVKTTSKLPVSCQLPEGVYLADQSTEEYVYIVINGVATKEIQIAASDIHLIGIPEGMNAYIDDANQAITVTVIGSESLVQSATASDLVLSADITNLTEGVHMVNLTVDYVKSFRSAEVEPMQIQVSITNEAQ